MGMLMERRRDKSDQVRKHDSNQSIFVHTIQFIITFTQDQNAHALIQPTKTNKLHSNNHYEQTHPYKLIRKYGNGNKNFSKKS